MLSQTNKTSKSKRTSNNVKKGKSDQQMNISADYHTELSGFNFNSGNESLNWLQSKVEIDDILQNNNGVFDHWDKFRERSKIK